MDPDEIQNAANAASSAMGPLAQVVSAYYHNLVSRQVPERLAAKLARDFQWWYVENDVEAEE